MSHMALRERTWRSSHIVGFCAGCIASVLLFGVTSAPKRAAADLTQQDSAAICGNDATNSGSNFYSEMAEISARMHHAMNVAPSGNVDRDFAHMMIPHHQGAVAMAIVQLKYGRDEKLKRLAQAIIVEQGQEIAYMRSLLDAQHANKTSIPATK